MAKFSSVRWLAGLAVANLVIIVVMQVVGRHLHPYNIVQFEFAGSVQESLRLVHGWKERGALDAVFFLIGFDYLFMVAYSTFLWLACEKAAQQFSGGVRRMASVTALLQFAAAGLDGIENVALFQMASESQVALWPILSFTCAAPKFLIVLFGLGVGASGLIGWFVSMAKNPR